jgi:hypothetical protein
MKLSGHDASEWTTSVALLYAHLVYQAAAVDSTQSLPGPRVISDPRVLGFRIRVYDMNLCSPTVSDSCTQSLPGPLLISDPVV